MRLITRGQPRPVVMFAERSDDETIHAAVRAGVSAYLVDGLSAERLQPIMQVATGLAHLVVATKGRAHPATVDTTRWPFSNKVPVRCIQASSWAVLVPLGGYCHDVSCILRSAILPTRTQPAHQLRQFYAYAKPTPRRYN